MELFSYLTHKIDYSDCESLIEVSSRAYAAFNDLGVNIEDVLDSVRKELNIEEIGGLFDEFEELSYAQHYSTAISDVLEFEGMIGKYAWDVTDVVVGLMMLRATPELRDQLRTLPFRKK
jgi:hypothetical protein